MDHQEATRCEAVEKYLLNELAPPERDEFEEHFFDCPECAADLRTTAEFLDSATRELKRAKPTMPAPKLAGQSRFGFLWRPAFAGPAFALLLLVIAYQNLAVYPRLTGEIARLNNPEVLAAVSLIGSNSRGGPSPSITVTQGQPLLIFVDIPATEQYSSYSCVLVAPSGASISRVTVSAEQAKDTVAIRIPAGNWREGDYRLTVQGHADPPRGQPAELARHRFTLHVSN